MPHDRLLMCCWVPCDAAAEVWQVAADTLDRYRHLASRSLLLPWTEDVPLVDGETLGPAERVGLLRSEEREFEFLVGAGCAAAINGAMLLAERQGFDAVLVLPPGAELPDAWKPGNQPLELLFTDRPEPLEPSDFGAWKAIWTRDLLVRNHWNREPPAFAMSGAMALRPRAWRTACLDPHDAGAHGLEALAFLHACSAAGVAAGRTGGADLPKVVYDADPDEVGGACLSMARLACFLAGPPRFEALGPYPGHLLEGLPERVHDALSLLAQEALLQGQRNRYLDWLQVLGELFPRNDPERGNLEGSVTVEELAARSAIPAYAQCLEAWRCLVDRQVG